MEFETKIHFYNARLVTPSNDCKVVMICTEPFNVVSGKFNTLTQKFYTNDNKPIEPLLWAFAEDLEYEVEDYIVCCSIKKDH